jgi:tRNA-2-methylthio-N6-dimethylallyladenosine synthase
MHFQNRQDEISLDRNLECLGKIIEVMIEDCNETSSKGRTAANQVVHTATEAAETHPGDLVMVRIDHAGKHSLRGTIIP